MGGIIGRNRNPKPKVREQAPPVHIPFGIVQNQGQRKYMEDYAFGRSMLSEDEPGLKEWLPGGARGEPKHGAFCVMDGHGGAEAAEMCSQLLLRNVLEAGLTASVPTALRKGFEKTEEEICNKCRSEGLGCGTTVVMVLMFGEAIFVAHVGDSFAVIDRGGSPSLLTKPHLVQKNRAEADRLQKLGAKVDSSGRVVHPQAATVKIQVTRSLGDITFKDPSLTDGVPTGVSSDVDIHMDSVYPGMDHFILLASDGVSDVMSLKTACRLVTHVLIEENGSCEEAAQAVVDASLARGSQDNVTALVVDIRPPCPPGAAKE